MRKKTIEFKPVSAIFEDNSAGSADSSACSPCSIILADSSFCPNSGSKT